MEEKKETFAKTYQFGNTTVVVHSDLLKMTEEERDKWFREQRAAGNPDLLALERTVNEAYRKFYKGEETY
ncbi:hypothetical protein [Peribacillus sp. TH14]|uniref:hypothetical protein n=1 Tax=Peribacillus sp. TH14 TaxID=2798481 RepID=UPI001913F2C8|nr:hypothetical protein [Peribacillus sp. TH14]MBK5500942.1 hypothetical protein [Peribacillus sp. TH14]